MRILTALEETVLIVIYRLGEDTYSVNIHQKILEMTGKDMIIGSLYNVLDQLSKKGYLNKKRGTPVSQKGGKRKMFYFISREGFKALEETKRQQSILWEGLPDKFTRETEF